MRGNWNRVTKAHPCPICGRPDWCLFTGPEGSPTEAICARTESPKRCGEAGWLHKLTDEDNRDDWRRVRRIVIPSRPEFNRTAAAIDFERLAHRCDAALKPEALERLADSLGLTAASLRRLSVGWSARHVAFTFPMRDGSGQVVGIRLRRPDGGKSSVTGGREGLFIPLDIEAGGRLIVTEGPTDCAALLDVGLIAVGRPSCSGGTKAIGELVSRLKPLEVAIIADGDTPGMRGGESLAAILVAYVNAVRLLTPPANAKDVRAWRIAGATRSDFEAAIDAAPIRQLGITTRRATR
jgi:hypothetical protein